MTVIRAKNGDEYQVEIREPTLLEFENLMKIAPKDVKDNVTWMRRTVFPAVVVVNGEKRTEEFFNTLPISVALKIQPLVEEVFGGADNPLDVPTDS